MKKFAAVKDDGTIIYTMSTSEPEYENEKKIGEQTFIEIPSSISDSDLLSNYYWRDGWILRPPIPGKYYKWDMVSQSWIPNLSNAKEDKKKFINKKREEILISNNNPLQYNGNIFTNDSRTRNNLSELLNLINSGVPLPANFVFRTKDNVNVPFSEQDVKNLLSLFISHKNSCYEHSWDLKEQIDSLETVEEVEVFDINQGWPE